MTVDSLSSQLDVIAAADESLADVASRMRWNDVGSVAVMDHGKLAGVLTERDLTRAIADGANPVESRVEDYMTTDPIAVSAGTAIREAARIMVNSGVRHLPVLDNGQLVGILSMRDIVAALVLAPTDA